jgi:hypothetical protein
MDSTQQILKAIEGIEKKTTEAIQNVEKRLTERMDNLEKGQKSIRAEMATKDDLKPVNKKLDILTSEVLHTKTAIEALSEGQREMRETMATKADVLDLGVKISKNHTKTKIRLENLEDHTGTTDPTTN